jgi:hypothetical protein
LHTPLLKRKNHKLTGIEKCSSNWHIVSRFIHCKFASLYMYLY